jgi:ketosteroid isomerase-like protein
MGPCPPVRSALVVAMLLASSLATGCSFFTSNNSKPPPSTPAHDPRRDEKELLRIEEDLHVAFMRHDTKYVGQVLSEDFLAIDANGNGYDRAKQLGEFNDPTVCEYITPYDMRVKVYGDAAVVTGRTKAKCRAEGADLHVSTRWTDVFIRRDKKWKWVAAQFANLPTQ